MFCSVFDIDFCVNAWPMRFSYTGWEDNLEDCIYKNFVVHVFIICFMVKDGDIIPSMLGLMTCCFILFQEDIRDIL